MSTSEAEAVPASRGRLLLVDDEPQVLRALQRALGTRWELATADGAEAGLALLARFEPAVVISDFEMPAMDGVEFLAKVKERAPDAQRIMLTGHADQHAIESAINRSEIFRLLHKPWEHAQLLLTVTSAFEQYTMQADLRRLQALTQEQNRQLTELNADLEMRVALRTRALATGKREWELTFDSLDTPLAVVGKDRTVRRANRAYAKVCGRAVTEVMGRPACHQFLFDRETPCPGCPLELAFETGKVQRSEVSHAGRAYVVTVHPMVDEHQIVCRYRDVTDERELNRRLLESDKMAAVGQLAGGVAHEINNPLGGILAFAQLMKRDAGRSVDDQEALDLIEESALRCKRIVDSLLRLSRRSREDDRRPFDLSSCVDDAVNLFSGQLKSAPRARLELALASMLPRVHGDPAQLSQVVLNLLQNALQALPAREGKISVETGELASGNLFLRVRDTGTGIKPEHLPRIFEASFTTKPPGEGTGLGLAIAYRIVEDHGGAFAVETEVGRGSSFTVQLPALLPNPTPRSTP